MSENLLYFMNSISNQTFLPKMKYSHNMLRNIIYMSPLKKIPFLMILSTSYLKICLLYYAPSLYLYLYVRIAMTNGKIGSNFNGLNKNRLSCNSLILIWIKKLH